MPRGGNPADQDPSPADCAAAGSACAASATGGNRTGAGQGRAGESGRPSGVAPVLPGSVPVISLVVSHRGQPFRARASEGKPGPGARLAAPESSAGTVLVNATDATPGGTLEETARVAHRPGNGRSDLVGHRVTGHARREPHGGRAARLRRHRFASVETQTGQPLAGRGQSGGSLAPWCGLPPPFPSTRSRSGSSRTYRGVLVNLTHVYGCTPCAASHLRHATMRTSIEGLPVKDFPASRRGVLRLASRIVPRGPRRPRSVPGWPGPHQRPRAGRRRP